MSEAESLYGEEHVRRYRETGGEVGHALSTLATSGTDDALASDSTHAAALVDGFHGAFAAGAHRCRIVATLVLIRGDEIEQVDVVEAEPAVDLAA